MGPLALALALCGCGTSSSAAPLQTPTPGSTPEQVVASFIAAINARDASVLAATSEPGLATSIAETWFGTTIDQAEIDPSRTGEFGVGTAYAAQENVYVHIDAVFHRTDGSLPEGELTGWGYYLTRDDASSNWYIWTQGSS